MRKKYLSALLFGALLFASAGTFTSCKDYDDDINNLQEQINTINTTLEELTGKINGLGAGVTDFKYENGKLVIVTDKGTNFEVTLPEADGIKELEIKDGILYADGEKVGVVAGEGGAVNVEVKDGILYINGEAQELNDEVGSKVVVVDNGNGTYTLTVDGTSIVLPKASVSVGIIATDEVYFTNLSHVVQVVDQDDQPTTEWGQNAEGGIVWGTADSYRGNWKGLKSVAKGQLLVGQISTVQVKVNAATFDLSTAKLTLVNTLGEEAPVTVTPVAEGKKGPAVADTRAADANGVWNLKIEMKSDVTADNIATKFAAKDDNNAYRNVKYALAVDGKVATDYIYFIDTKQAKANSNDVFSFTHGSATTSLNFIKDGAPKTAVVLNTGEAAVDEIPIGTSTTFYLAPKLTDSNTKMYVDRVYDSYIEIKDQDLADKHGITASGMTLNVSADAAALTNFPIVVHVLDIHGNEVESAELNVKFAASTVAGQTLGDQKYTLMPSTDPYKKFVVVELGDVFTSLTADEAVAISTAKGSTGTATWYSAYADEDNQLFATTGADVDGMREIANLTTSGKEVLFYETKEQALAYGLKYDKDVAIKLTKNGTTNADVKASTIRKIAYAVIPFDAIKTNALPNVAAPLTLVLKDKDGNEIRKASGTYTVTLPSFDDVLVANTNKVWKENTFYTRVATTDGNDGKISLVQPFKSKVAEDKVGYIDLNTADSWLSYELKYTDFAKEDQYIKIATGDKTTTLGIMTGDFINEDKAELLHDIDVVATLNLLYDDHYQNFKVTKEFKVYLQSIFEGSTVSYYVDGEEVKGAMTLEDYKYIYPGHLSGTNKVGVYMNFDGETQPFNFVNGASFTQGYATEMTNPSTQISTAKPNTWGDATGAVKAQTYIYMADGAVGTLERELINYGTAASPNNKQTLKITLSESNSGQLIFTFVDMMGVRVDATLNYQKNAPETAE